MDAPGVLDQFDDWRRRHVHIKLSDYYDELEKEFDALEAQGPRTASATREPKLDEFPEGHCMLLAEVQDRARFIGEEFCDLEVATDQIHDLYWAVLIAIANGQCEDASPKEFAAAVVGLEELISGPYTPEGYAELQKRLAGWNPWWEVDAPPTTPKRRKKPKKLAKKAQQRAKRTKRG